MSSEYHPAPPPASEILSAALALAARGCAAFPMTLAKRPACAHGVKDASRDPETLRRWFSRCGLIPAIATGTPSDVAVLDIDRQYGGGEWWQANRHRLPDTWAWRTRSGGLHVAFRHRAGLGSSVGVIAAGIDVRGEGTSAIFWPAIGLPVLSSVDPAPWPAWLSPPTKSTWESLLSDDAPRVPERIEAALAGLVRVVAWASHGERNVKLHWAACRAAEMITRAEISRPHAEAVLTEAAARAGLPVREALGTVQSAFRGAR